MASLQEIFTKTLPEDVVQYEIYLLDPDSETDVQRSLEDVRIKCLALAASFTCDYIWNNEGFNLRKSRNTDDGTPCLIGITNFGDFIEDEWFIVWLLFQISSVYKDLVCRVKDNDGEFLLIEAADFLPKWLNPDTAKNRVYVHNGSVHLVPKPRNPGEIGDLPNGTPSVPQAIEIIRTKPGWTQAHVNVTKAIERRIAGFWYQIAAALLEEVLECQLSCFPQKAMEHVQKVNVFVPESIACILDREPNLVSAAVRAFYYRDPIDLRACRVFKQFRPETRTWCQVCMNRCSYAQLMQQVFRPDKRSGYTVPKNCGGDFKGMDLGSKLAHGFEILYSSCVKNRSDAENLGVFNEAEFAKFFSALEKRDYFRGEIEGSKRHAELLENAKTYFRTCDAESERNVSSVRESIGHRIHSIINDISDGPKTFRKVIPCVRRLDLPDESGDEWMYLDEDKMNDVLRDMKNGFEEMVHKKRDTTPKDADLNDLGAKMKNFVAKLSDYEGVEVPSGSRPVDFDMEGFSAALEGILSNGRGVTEGDDSDYSLSEDFLSSDSESDEGDVEIREAMAQMDRELSSTKVGQSFVGMDAGGDVEDSKDGSERSFKPVDIDLNLVQNFLESCSGEFNLPGPATNLMQSVGLNVGNGS